MESIAIASPLDTFLQQSNIESSPAWEFIHGQAQQKMMPTLFHSRLQRNLVNAINSQTQAYEAIQELRCIVPPLSPVPDISVVKSDRLTEVDGPLQGTPDWLIEIRSPDQNTLELQNKILLCLINGTQLAWLIDIQRKQIWVWEKSELPLIYSGTDILPTLGNISNLTVEMIMAMTQQR
ncbi:Uma2 family endonuclease [Pseudanabaena sp. 'Roaring Creek']|uniref:Uma2 family endonuclease n=1 Tax=Pseudanabaena sp. 'Roaring Creek' TaxID=1681830 RepID=UPI0006D84483|nr:Uma2 family endonuclease [Pseudanabaena sp. 'Roaring Creek']